ncbi:MAG: PQQ-binding-like beta-propeller repeat protein, partial [Thermoplasmata archaeon]|nr:PQQ-binding-like beta-propeller repeat protein [Thermoplasmata archaeon]
KKLFVIDENKIYPLNGKWKYECEAEITDVFVDGDIYVVSYDGNIYCLDKEGGLKWKFTAGWSIVDIDFDDYIYAGSYDGNIYCLDKEGNLVWAFSCNASISHIKKYGDYVFVASTDGRFYAVNKSDGNVAFSYAPSYEIEGLYNYITTPILSNIVAVNGKALFSAGGKIYCMDAQTIEKERQANEDATPLSHVIIAVFVIAIITTAILYIRRRF